MKLRNLKGREIKLVGVSNLAVHSDCNVLIYVTDLFNVCLSKSLPSKATTQNLQQLYELSISRLAKSQI